MPDGAPASSDVTSRRLQGAVPHNLLFQMENKKQGTDKNLKVGQVAGRSQG